MSKHYQLNSLPREYVAWLGKINESNEILPKGMRHEKNMQVYATHCVKDRSPKGRPGG